MWTTFSKEIGTTYGNTLVKSIYLFFLHDKILSFSVISVLLTFVSKSSQFQSRSHHDFFLKLDKWNLMIPTEEQRALDSWGGPEGLSTIWPNWSQGLSHVWQFISTVNLWQNYGELCQQEDRFCPVENLKSYWIGMADCCYCSNWLSVGNSIGFLPHTLCTTQC